MTGRDDSARGSSARRSVASRRGLLAVLAAVALLAVVASGVVVWRDTDGGGPLARLDDLRHPPAPVSLEHEQLLGVAADFVQRFNTYGPDLLDDAGTMPEYAALADEMTAKFGAVFESNLTYAEQTVAELDVRRRAQVYAVGVASADADSAELLVAGTATFSYPNPDKRKTWVEFDPERFRYQVSLVRQHGEWLVDDLDDVDDDLPSLAQSTPQDGAGLPGELPSQGAGTGDGGKSAGDQAEGEQ
ncbi:hypothetical protein E8D34_02270 [Nocardioides sp. GY 10113]|uniref:hypothetical protein n=1 Tax=Nocardioides sp. GY 10113 TaxID=2569761 RepID=UPI0010A8C9F2|nr:hypothetical protein [Nocardioides sp. GY 10113]TIC89330.1 hypothetical protein E8D34_02270 [Nocardioides sp. GY 10113]